MLPWGLAFGFALIALNVVVCISIVANPESAASVFAGQGNGFTLMLYRSVLSFSWMDCERDLTADTPFPALVRNCRRRAISRLQIFFFGLVILVAVSIITGQLPRFSVNM